MQNVLSGIISVDQYSSSIGTVWKSSSSMSEDSGVVSLELSEVSMGLLSLLKDRWQHTGLAGVYVRSLADVTGLLGVLCCVQGQKMHVLCWIHGVCMAFCIRVLVSLHWNHSHSLHLPAIAAV